MANMLEEGMGVLANEMIAHAATAVVYHRGADQVSLNCVLTQELLRVIDAQGRSKVERVEGEAFIRAADLLLSGLVTTPRDGDWLAVTFGGVVHKLEAMPYGDEACWRYADAFRKGILVRCKYAGTV